MRRPHGAFPTRRWPWILVALVGTVGTLLGVSGMVMAGSFSAATTWPPPAGHEAHWHRVGQIYLWVTLVSLSAFGTALVMLWRRRRSTRAGASRERASG